MCSGPEAGMASINRSPRWSMCERGNGALVERPVTAITDLSGAPCVSQPMSEFVMMRGGSDSYYLQLRNWRWLMTFLEHDFSNRQNVAESFSTLACGLWLKARRHDEQTWMFPKEFQEFDLLWKGSCCFIVIMIIMMIMVNVEEGFYLLNIQQYLWWLKRNCSELKRNLQEPEICMCL